MKKKQLWTKLTFLALLLIGLTYLNLSAQETKRSNSVWWTPELFPQSGETLRQRLGDLELVGEWVYNDVDEGFRRAAETGKPLMVVFR
jgi:hypothetical protein